VEKDNSALTISSVRSGLGVGIVGGNSDSPLLKQLASTSLRRELGRAQIVHVLRAERIVSAPVAELVRILGKTHGAGR